MTPTKQSQYVDPSTLEMLTELIADDKKARLEYENRLWQLFHCIDSVHKLLKRSERLEECTCAAACFRDIEGPKIILRDTLQKFEDLLAEGSPGFSAEFALNDIVRSQKGGAL